MKSMTGGEVLMKKPREHCVNSKYAHFTMKILPGGDRCHGPPDLIELPVVPHWGQGVRCRLFEVRGRMPTCCC